MAINETTWLYDISVWYPIYRKLLRTHCLTWAWSVLLVVTHMNVNLLIHPLTVSPYRPLPACLATVTHEFTHSHTRSLTHTLTGLLLPTPSSYLKTQLLTSLLILTHQLSSSLTLSISKSLTQLLTHPILQYSFTHSLKKKSVNELSSRCILNTNLSFHKVSLLWRQCIALR